MLRACYLNALTLAAERGCRSIAFPLISSGSYGYPKSEAFGVAAAAIASFLQEHEMTVYLAVFDRAALAVSQALLGAVQQYIDQNYVDEQTERFARLRSAETVSAPLLQPYASAPEQAGKKRKPARARHSHSRWRWNSRKLKRGICFPARDMHFRAVRNSM